jgi:hypothetical protein
MSLYSCAACSEFIPAAKARIQCQNCTQYDLCASCFVVGKTSLAHQISHDTTLFTASGHNFATLSKLKQPSAPIPNPLIRRRPLIAPPALPPRPLSSSLPYHSGPSSALLASQEPSNQASTSQNEPQYQQIPPPAAYTPSPSNQTSIPLQVPNQPNYQSTPVPVTTPHIPENPYANPPTSVNPIAHPSAQPPITTPLLAENPYANPPSHSPGGTGTQTKQDPPQGPSTPQWQTLQTAGIPSPFLRSMLSAVFERVDVHRTGTLSPEQYSAFLDVQQYRLEENVCRCRQVI